MNISIMKVIVVAGCTVTLVFCLAIWVERYQYMEMVKNDKNSDGSLFYPPPIDLNNEDSFRLFSLPDGVSLMVENNVRFIGGDKLLRFDVSGGVEFHIKPKSNTMYKVTEQGYDVVRQTKGQGQSNP